MALTTFSASLTYRWGFCSAMREINSDLIMSPSQRPKRSQGKP
jgi:hypothetical protein